MSIAAIGALGVINSTDSTGSTGSTGSTTTPKTPGTLDREAFLKLLVAQLRYQDPSKPLDPSEMVSQSAQLSVVDKLSEISTALTRSSTIDRLALAGSVIGKDVTFASPEGLPVTAQVTSVRFDGDSLLLWAGSYEVPLESVQAVHEHTVAAPPSADGSAA